MSVSSPEATPLSARARSPVRAVLLAGAILAMAAGIFGGLVRLGVPLLQGDTAAGAHGALMVCGLFGTLISLERAVAIGRWWAYPGPVLFVAATLLLLLRVPAPLPELILAGAAAAFTLATLSIFLRQRALFTLALAAGAAALLAGNALRAAGAEIPAVAGWWIAFLVCTIAAERLELSRMLQPPRTAEPLFVLAMAVLAGGAAIGLEAEWGRLLCGAGLLAITAWLVRYDIARTTVRRPGATRFFATAMLAGYVWLGVGGLVLLLGGGLAYQYDMALHAVFIGFVLSMVYGHALIILPAITGIKLSFGNRLYLPLVLLHLSAIFRVGGGLFEAWVEREFSGPLTALSLIVFGGTLVSLVRRRSAVAAAG